MQGRKTATATGLVLGLLAGALPASAAPVIGGTGTYQYVEGSSPLSIGTTITIADGGNFGGKYLEFGIDDAAATETLSLTSDVAASTTAGTVSIVGRVVHLGNGSGTDVIGHVDAASDGAGGTPLRVNLASELTNPSFETGDLTGWTALNQRVDLGVTTIAGCTSIDTSTYPVATFDFDNSDPIEPGELTSTLQMLAAPTDGIRALRARSLGLMTRNAHDVVHGPAIVSNSFPVAAGDSFFFDWRAFGGADNFHAQAYLVNSSCQQIEVLDAAGGTTTAWATSETVIPQAGSYRFVFVSGTFDVNGGQTAGASLYLDNVRVHGALASDDVVQQIARRLRYVNSSFDAPATRTVRVTAESASNGVGLGSIEVDIVPALEAPAYTDTTLAAMAAGAVYNDVIGVQAWPLATFSVTAGALPPGIALDPDTGALSGTPTTGGVYTATVTATNSEGSAVHVFSMSVSAAPATFVDGALGVPSAGTEYSDGVLADGTPAPTYAVTTGDLPNALTLDAGTGVVSGVPISPGQTYNFTVTATNAHGSIAQVFSGVVGVAPMFTDDTIGTPIAGAAMVDGVSADGLPAPSFAVTHGHLPTGLALDTTTGALTGTPTVRGQEYTFTITASNAAGQVARLLGGQVAAVPQFIDDHLDAFTVDREVHDGVSAHAVPAPLYGVSDGLLPSGLLLDGSTGAISGTPTIDAPFDFTIRATNIVGSTTKRFAGAVDPRNRGYLGLTPARLFDSRLLDAEPGAGAVIEVVVVGRGGVPSDSTAVVLNVAVTEADRAGFVTVYPCGQPAPWAANVNFVADETVSNSVTAAIGIDGKVCIFTSAPTHVVVDVNGAYSATEGNGHLDARSPVRLFDSRTDDVLLRAGTVHRLVVADGHDIPADTTAIVLNVAVDEPATDGYLNVFPCGRPVPFAANLNFHRGAAMSNAVTAAIGDDGAVCFFTTADAHLIVDSTGVYRPVKGMAVLTGVVPERLFDSRADRAPLTTGTVHSISIGGRSGIPAGARAVALNLAVTEPLTAGFVTAYPCGETIPVTASLNFVAGQTVSNGTVVAIGEGGRICFLSSTTSHLVVDVNGVFAD